MVEEGVVHREPGERVQTCGDHGPAFGFCIAVQPHVSRQAAHAEFQDQQRNHQKGKRLGGEQRAQPEKGRPQQIEGIRVHCGRAQVRLPAPLPGGVLDKVVHIGVERDLLRVEVAAVLEQPLVNDHKGQINQRGGGHADEERKQIPVSQIFTFQSFHLRILPVVL